MGAGRLLGLGALIGSLALTFMAVSMKLSPGDQYILPMIAAAIGAVLGLAAGGLAAATEKASQNGNSMARIAYWGALGGLAGTLAGVPMSLVLDAGNGQETMMARTLTLVLFTMIGAILFICYGILTRKASADEKFLPGSSTDSKRKPVKPLAGNIILVVLVAIGTVRKSLAIFDSQSAGFDAALVISIFCWLLFVYVVIRVRNSRYKRLINATSN